jgi:hypothetical protein
MSFESTFNSSFYDDIDEWVKLSINNHVIKLGQIYRTRLLRSWLLLMIMAAIEAVFFVGLFLLLHTTVRFTEYTRTAGDFSFLLLVL